jgi:hypothetical protein
MPVTIPVDHPDTHFKWGHDHERSIRTQERVGDAARHPDPMMSLIADPFARGLQRSPRGVNPHLL